MYGNKNQYTCIADQLLEEPENQNECIVLSFFPQEQGLWLGPFSASSSFSPYFHDAGQVRVEMADIFRSILVTLVRKSNPMLQAQRYLFKSFSLMLGDNKV